MKAADSRRLYLHYPVWPYPGMEDDDPAAQAVLDRRGASESRRNKRVYPSPQKKGGPKRGESAEELRDLGADAQEHYAEFVPLCGSPLRHFMLSEPLSNCVLISPSMTSMGPDCVAHRGLRPASRNASLVRTSTLPSS